MGMSLLQTTISEAQLRPTSGAQAPRNVVRQHARGRTEFSAQKSSRSGKTVDSSPAAEEWRLIRRALTGDPDALSPIFVHYNSRLFRTAFSLLRNKEDAEDAVQEGLINAYIHLSSFQGRSLFSTWLTRIVMNAALMALRRKRARLETSLDECQEREVDDHRPSRAVDCRPNPEQACATMEVKQIVEKHIDQLSPRSRIVFRLREVKGFSTKEAREVLGIAEGVVKARLFRARGQLTKSLRRSFRIPMRDVKDISPGKTMVAISEPSVADAG
jgi:RNA polymerase sigma factor (sigma-70 family)